MFKKAEYTEKSGLRYVELGTQNQWTLLTILNETSVTQFPSCKMGRIILPYLAGCCKDKLINVCEVLEYYGDECCRKAHEETNSVFTAVFGWLCSQFGMGPYGKCIVSYSLFLSSIYPCALNESGVQLKQYVIKTIMLMSKAGVGMEGGWN